MNDELRDTTVEVIITTLEELAFMFAEPVESSEVPQAEGEICKVSMTFSGHSDGKVEMIMVEEQAVELAANMMGMAEDEPLIQKFAHDSMRELLNVLCGHLLTAFAGNEVIFDLSVPVVKTISSDEWQDVILDDNWVLFDLDDRPFAITADIIG